MKPNIAIRYGASNDDIVVDGIVFVRHKLPKQHLTFVRNVVIDTLLKVGVIARRKK